MDEELESRGQADPRQQSLDFLRAEQLRLLRDCELPKDARDKAGSGVKAHVLKAVLNAIDHYGRGRAGGAFASVATLAASANVGPRTVTRAIEVLQALGLLCVTNDGSRWGVRGSPTNRYTIVWSELALLADRGDLARARPSDHRATRGNCASDQSATLTDQSATLTDQSATLTDQSATGGALNASKRFEAPSNTTDDSCATGSAATPAADESSRVGAEGRYFFEDEIAAVRAKANRIHAEACARTSADRELVLKLATLWHDGELPDDAVEQVLESYHRKRAAGDPVRNLMGWLWTTMREQCQRRQVRFERLLAMADFPRELLAPPRQQPADVP